MKHKLTVILCIYVVITLGTLIGVAYVNRYEANRAQATIQAEIQQTKDATNNLTARLQRQKDLTAAAHDQCLKDQAIYNQVPATIRVKLPAMICQ